MTRRQDRSRLRTHPELIAWTEFGVMENWCAISDYPGYFVSDAGRVCSIDRIVNGKICCGRVLRPAPSRSGHLSVVLGRGNTQAVHTLVLTAFRGPCPAGNEGLHADDNPTNNKLVNLRWGTRSENLHDAIRNGKKPIGERAYNARLTEDAVRYIRANPQFSMHSLGQHFGVSAQAIKQVREGITWKHVA